MKKIDLDHIKATLKTKSGSYNVFQISKLKKFGFANIDQLPFSIKILLESAIRNCDEYKVTSQDIQNIASWSSKVKTLPEIAFKPGRVILQDFTGVPCVVDLAAMRNAVKNLGGDYRKINPQVQCDLIIDHSVQVDYAGTKYAFQKNLTKEFKRNKERYEFLKWGQQAFKNFRVIPPATGIIHQINLEYLAQGVLVQGKGKNKTLYPDSLIGTDSHTTMINGLGVAGWGVGGIEAEAVMLGEPLNMLLPQVVGFHLKGKLRDGITPTDLVLTIVEKLRKVGVVGKFVEYFGEGLESLTLENRAMIANMSPEYGATMGIFPVDSKTLEYYRETGRSKDQIELIEKYFKLQGMFYKKGAKPPKYTKTIELDLNTIQLSMAGPKRPQDRIVLGKMKSEFSKNFSAPKTTDTLTNGSVVIASITSCTNTSDPSVLIGAGLLAKNAIAAGLKIKPFVKTSLAPGSRVVVEYLKKAGLISYLEMLGFHLAGYGCMTCIGNSGPLAEEITKKITDNNLIVASVLSGNRNFEGRISPWVKANYLASPALVVGYAIAGNISIDLTTEPLGKNKKGEDVYLSDIWPTNSEIKTLIKKSVQSKMFVEQYRSASKGTSEWKEIKSTKSDLYSWKEKSTYIQNPPFFSGMKKDADDISEIKGARALLVLGDSITTDHISPAGAISSASPAGQFLQSKGIKAVDFNSYGSRRGNDQIMTRGTFANIRLKNLLAPGTEGSQTIYLPTNEKMDIYSASLKYKKDQTPLVVLAGKEYGTGSSRDWAAKGTALLGIKVVIAESYERIHRSNLVGMGVLPLEFIKGQSYKMLGLKGDEFFDFIGLSNNIKPQQKIKVIAVSSSGTKKEFYAKLRLDTKVDIDYYRNGGILQTVLRQLI
ncbi:MAG: aconitate hydratase AcnA [Candidatus Omnitrophica bacterium]|nr:aconitate hydratase AcnA [Candidatus Omnitrophota bacterium]